MQRYLEYRSIINRPANTPQNERDMATQRDDHRDVNGIKEQFFYVFGNLLSQGLLQLNLRKRNNSLQLQNKD
jgi:hypothetical protein